MFVFAIFYLFIVSINGDVANFTIIRQSPQTNILLNTNQFIFQSKNKLKIEIYFFVIYIYLVNQTVNQPSFQAFINIYNATTNASIYSLDVHNITNNVTYSNQTLTFYLPNSVAFHINDQFYITFDAGVLFSITANSTAQTSRNFWYLTVIDTQTSTSVTTMTENTSMGTTHTAATHSDTSAFIVSTVTTYTSINPTIQTSTTTTSTSVNTPKGIIAIFLQLK